MTKITQELLKGVLRYEPDTGRFYWLSSGRGRRVDLLAGSLDKRGYWRISIGGRGCRGYRSSNLAFLYMTGEWPPGGEADHINTDTGDDRWENLRPATRVQNLANRRVMGNSASGVKGAMSAKGKFRARIRVGGKRVNVGTFATAEEANAAYAVAAAAVFGEYSRA